MFKSLALLTALVVATATMAKADQISINGSDTYDTTAQTFQFMGPLNAQGYPLGNLGFGTQTGMFSSFGYCNQCVVLQKNPINYGSTFTPTVIFTTGSPSNFVNVTLDNITSVDTTTGLTIIGNATVDLNGNPLQGVLTLTTQGQGAVTFSATTSAVPEPASLALFGSGLLGIVGLARRRFNV